MAQLNFYKYQGTGNDFIMIDNRQGVIELDIPTIQQLCDRKFGIGSDGLILISPHKELDFYMDFYNPDGSQSFCGNGSRCSVAFAHFLGLIGSQTHFEAIDGEHKALINDRQVEVLMGQVDDIELEEGHYFIDTGSPHYIVEKDEVANLDMVEFGRSIRYNDRFKEVGTNVNAFELKDKKVFMRTYERGVENETLSCGTGVTAVALSALHKGYFDNEVPVETKGGQLTVKAQRNASGFSSIWLCGPAELVYQGSIEI